MTDLLQRTRQAVLKSLLPPERLPLSTWIERDMVLPASVADTPGKVELWPFQRGIADALTDPEIEKVTFVKPTRVGFTTLLSGFIGSHIANDPAPIGVYLPVEDDCRTYMTKVLEPIFEATDCLRNALSGGDDRDTMLDRQFIGGSLQILAARAARNFRAKNFRIVLLDEVDAMLPTSEGNALDLAEKRTDSFRNRKVVVGSTPVQKHTSNVLRRYATSDMRIYECPCPACGAVTEIIWDHIKWPKKQPELAYFLCPHCGEPIQERYKLQMVTDGTWRATRPEVVGHAGFRMNALISLLPNTTWAHLATEWMQKHKDPDTLQVFINTRLAEGFQADGEEVDASGLKARVEDISLDALPAEILMLSTGTDVQVDRLEVSLIGWCRPLEIKLQISGRETTIELPVAIALDHTVIIGRPEDGDTWQQHDDYLARTYKHPLGGTLKIAASVVDSGNWTDEVYDYCFPRFHRGVMAGKGMAGFKRKTVERSKTRTRSKSGQTGTLFQIGVDALKQRIFTRLHMPKVMRFARQVLVENPDYFEQLTNERRVLKYVAGQAVHKFERKMSGAPVEALDCFVYAMAARDTRDPVNWDALESRLTVAPDKKPARSLADLSRSLNGR